MSAIFGWNPIIGLTLGIILTLIGSIMMAGGSTYMKVGINMESEKQQRLVTYPYYEPNWWIGFVFYILGSTLHVAALGFAPASVLAPMNSIGLIVNAILASAILKESFGTVDIISTSGTAIGVTFCALASFFTDGLGQNSSPDDEVLHCMASWRKPWYLIYLVIGGISGLIIVIFVEIKENDFLEDDSFTNENLINLGELSYNKLNSNSIQVPVSKPVNVKYSPGSFPRQIGISYGYLAGLIGAQCVLQLKEIVSCLEKTIEGDYTIFYEPASYLLTIFLLLSVWLQIYYLNLGLARGDSTYVVPTYYVVWTVFGTFGGFAKFDEYQGYSPAATILFSIGLAMTVLCVAILAIQEMLYLRRFVDEKVPEMPDELMDLATQDLVDQQMKKKVTFGMGLFQFSLLGRTVGRKRYKNLYRMIRRIRSTASDTAIEDRDIDISIDNNRYIGTHTVPHSLRFSQQPRNNSNKLELPKDRRYVPLEDQ